MISVIVPVYNAEKQLERCLDTLKNQTYHDFEVLIIDDGSKDRSAEIAQARAQSDRRFRLIRQNNAGVSAARNTGIVNTRGEALCFCDADDYMESDMLEKLLSEFQPGSVTVCNFSHNDSREPVLPMPRRTVPYDFDSDFIRTYLVGELGGEMGFSPWNKLFDRKILLDHAILFPKNVKVGEDMIFVLHYLSCCSKIRFVKESLYHYCVRNDSAMNNASKDYSNEYETTLQVLEKESFNGYVIDEQTLNLCAREALTIVLTNPYVVEQRYDEFKKYYRKLKNIGLFHRAGQNPLGKNIKRNILSLMIRSGSCLGLYMIIKMNR